MIKKILHHKYFLWSLIIGITIFLLFSYHLQKHLIEIYNSQKSTVVLDRNQKVIYAQPNQKGNWSFFLDSPPKRFKDLLIKKEDKYFYYHFGFNPWSSFRALIGYLGLGPKRASSTITQQLVKILLGKEFERNIKNKIIEAFYAFSLEIFQSKETILTMYTNSIYLGNHVQGLSEASRLYFNTSPELLTDGEILQILATISSPAKNNPASPNNKEIAEELAKKIFPQRDISSLDFLNYKKVRDNMQRYQHKSNLYFELKDLLNTEAKVQRLTLDKDLNKRVREIILQNVEDFKPKNVSNAAAVIIKLPENELLAIVGSPDPSSFQEGYKINMAIKPRPIGSTIKPFIYLKAFEKGARPYTLVEDREYKYITAVGFPLYPKNFDYKYRGIIDLHYALSNSLNVPAVKVLEYVGLEDFYRFLKDDLGFKPVQDLNNYQLGIALGSLEMNLLDLCRYFTIFPNHGILKDLKIDKDKNEKKEKRISKEKYIQLVNKILNDRTTGIEQFGLKSDLNLFQSNYALKTGTSRDFRDSWIIGYTPDFLVGVWMGNSDNSPMDEVSGQIGAGRIWSEIMEIMLNSDYNKKTPFSFNLIKEYQEGNNIEYGLPEDDYEKAKNLLLKEDELILDPHPNDIFLFQENSTIILKARKKVKWFVNGKYINQAKESFFSPSQPGNYQIEALSENGEKDSVTISIWE
ncbi:transglycosylase domain-containing protein [bacterium]|nr:transglycosylase domain-containing protein [bacterium]